MRPRIESQHVVEGLSHLLALADPVRTETAGDPVRQRLITEIGQGITSAPGIAGRRRPRMSLVLGIAALLLASAFTFASDWFMSDSDEFSQIVQGVVSSSGTEIPLPPGVTRQELEKEIVAEGQRDPGFMTETFVISSFVGKARCAWEGHWLTGYEQGNESRMDRAAQVLSQVPTWPTVAATDGGGMVRQHRRIARAAAAGLQAQLRRRLEQLTSKEQRFHDRVMPAGDAVLAYLQRRTQVAADAADLLGQVFEIAWRRIDHLPGEDGGDEGLAHRSGSSSAGQSATRTVAANRAV